MAHRILVLLALPLLLLALSPLVVADDSEDGEEGTSATILPSDFKKCAVKVFKESTDVADVFKDCEAEMNAYIESLQPADDSESPVVADGAMAGGATGDARQVKLAKGYEDCVVAVFDRTGSERAAVEACEKALALYLATVGAEVRGQAATLVRAAVHKSLARRSLGQEG